MTDLLTVLAEHLVAAVLLVALASQLAALLYPLFQRASRAVGADGRALLTWLYGLMPTLIAAVSVLLLHLPAVSGGLIPSHCHGSTCGAHTPQFGLASPAGISLVLVCIALAAIGLCLVQRAQRLARRRLYAMNLLSQPEPGRFWRLIESDEPRAWCAGYLRPQIFVTRGLISALAPAQVQAVLLHEWAHLQRRDNLRALLLQWATVLWPGGRKRRLWQDLHSATEQACDLAAARQAGSATELIAALQRLAASPDAAPVSAMAASPAASATGAGPDCAAVASRVRQLQTTAPPAAFAAESWLMISALGAGQIIALPVVAHIAIEWLTL
ncbi:M56 family metallopeptidase [Parahaliea mediterranea]|uniref:M56 family metallopeptidase n=1 Tax=Parahaliea mediterranea TaxID=651086 RepID=UPI0013005E70|nr:M56 family metallopeptidase [Parahaliea mediterranea]